LIPRLRQFIDAYPEIELTLQVSIPLLDVVAEDADLMVRFGTGRYADVEHVCLLKDEVTPLASPAYVREHGPFETPEDLLIRHGLFMRRRRRLSGHRNTFSPALAFAQASSCAQLPPA
jgi:DNA-binding transcriptional LysR family regulator